MFPTSRTVKNHISITVHWRATSSKQTNEMDLQLIDEIRERTLKLHSDIALQLQKRIQGEQTWAEQGREKERREGGNWQECWEEGMLYKKVVFV